MSGGREGSGGWQIGIGAVGVGMSRAFSACFFLRFLLGLSTIIT